MTVVMAVDKRCAASERVLQAESAASEIQRGKIHLWNILQNRSKMHSRKTVCDNEFATRSLKLYSRFMVSPHHVEQLFMIGLNASRREGRNLKMIQERGDPLPQKINKTSGLCRIYLKKIEELLLMKSPMQ